MSDDGCKLGDWIIVNGGRYGHYTDSGPCICEVTSVPDVNGGCHTKVLLNSESYGPEGAEEQRRVLELACAAPKMLAALEELLADPYLKDPINNDRMKNARAAVQNARGTCHG